jgi:hypothetical protein
VTPDGVNPSTVTLTVNTSGAVASRAGNNALWVVSSTAVLGGMLLLPFGRKRRIKGTLVVFGMMALLFAGVGCGGGSSPGKNLAAPGTFTLNVSSTATGGSKTVPIVVNIIK